MWPLQGVVSGQGPGIRRLRRQGCALPCGHALLSYQPIPSWLRHGNAHRWVQLQVQLEHYLVVALITRGIHLVGRHDNFHLVLGCR